MNEGLIPQRYAKALLAQATEQGCQAQIYQQMVDIEAAFEAHASLQPTVANPFVPFADKARLLLTAAGTDDKQSPLLADFITLLERNKRIDMARQAAIAYIELYRQKNRIYHVRIISAAQLDQAEKQRLHTLIEAHLKGATVEWQYQVDPDLIGGFVVDINSERLDASIANDLKQLKLKLLS